ncbi:MAG: 2OG-Fe(II) oxygenase, partial [Flavobacteriaceae bacterium CG_4_8_14_3_um_filter_31_8]
MSFTKNEIANIILAKLELKKDSLKKQFLISKETIGYFFIDDLLPKDLALEIYHKFPNVNDSVKRKSLREFKFTAFQMNKFNPLLEEVIYAFQDDRIVDLVANICGIEQVFPDTSLYAGGLSLMKKDNFLNPHLDNSHDKDRNRWRVLNLLYYVTPDWKVENGGNLELWPKGLKHKQITVESKFNRLVVMATHQKSWHSVTKVVVNEVRCCVSNYYFSEQPLLVSDSFHITTFRGRPEEKVRDFLLKLDSALRSSVRKLFKKGIREN